MYLLHYIVSTNVNSINITGSIDSGSGSRDSPSGLLMCAHCNMRTHISVRLCRNRSMVLCVKSATNVSCVATAETVIICLGMKRSIKGHVD